MRIPPAVRRAFRLPPSKEQIARELDDEVRFHVETRANALMVTGLSQEQAYAEALRRFGDVDDLRDYCVSIEVPQMQRAQFRERLHSVVQDIRLTLRQFRKSPSFTIVAALTLALGIGATTAIFTVVNGVVLRPLPFAESEKIVQLSGLDSKGQKLRFADRTFDQLVAENRTLSTLAEYNANGLSVSANGEVLRLKAAAVSRQFFDVLKVKPAAGRLFAPDEQRSGAAMVVVISHGMWVRQFGGAPDAIGATLKTGSTSMTVIGILGTGREFPADVDLWIPREQLGRDVSYTAHNWRVIGRIKDGMTLAQVSGDVSLVLRRLHGAIGEATATFDGLAITLREQIVGNIRTLLFLVLGASGVLLLIACANVTNLLIARLAARESEFAVRLAIGAGRWRLAQQLLIETSLLAAVGCVGGLLLALAGMRMLLVLRPAIIPRVGELNIDWRVLTFAAALSAGMAIMLGLVAAWRGARGDLRAALSQSQRSHGSGSASYRMRGSLVVLQLAMTVVLLTGAGLLARSFVGLMTIDPGFRTHGLVVAGLAPSVEQGSYALARRTLYYDALLDRARTISGVTSAGISDAEPFSGGSSNGTFLVLSSATVKITQGDFETLFRDKAHTGYATYRLASEGYFKALNIPLVTGRLFNKGDRAGAPHVAVVNASLARTQWPSESAIGKVIEFGNIDGDLTPITIVGIVGDTREEDLAQQPEPAVYVSYRQRPGPGNGADAFVIMSTTSEGPTISAARQAFTELRAGVPMRFQRVEEIIARSIASQRFMLLLVGVFGVTALLLATLGVYSVISYLVAQRGREISIRVALGARANDIILLVLGRGIALSLIGATVGTAAALAATRVLKKLLYGVSATDPLAFSYVIAVVCVVALLASYVPARRAAKARPMDVLRGG